MLSQIDEMMISQGLALLVVVIGALIVRWISPKANIQVINLHQTAFYIPKVNPEDNDPIVYTKTIIIRNSGRESAKNVEISHVSPPQHIKIFPFCDYEVTQNKELVHFLRIKSMPPKYQYSIEILSINDEPPMFLGVTHYNGVGKLYEQNLQPMYSKPFIWLLLLLMVSGMLMWSYFGIKILFYIYKQYGL